MQNPTPIAIRGGQFTTDQRLDRVREVDLRNLNFLVRDVLLTAELKTPRSYTWRCDVWLDQGSEGACVGFGNAHELVARPSAVKDINNQFAREKIYWEAQRIDEWEGGAYPGASPSYEGSSTRAGLEVLRKLGFIDEYRWALDLKEASTYLGYYGPLVIGVDWYEGMFGPDVNGFIHATGNMAGGHCICVIGVHIEWKNKTLPKTWDNVDMLASYWLLHNSWGQSWGQNGRAKLALIDVMKLWPGGDFACITGRHISPI